MTNQVATGINDDLQVAGCYIDSNNVSHGFFKDGSTYYAITIDPDAIQTYLVDLSNAVY